MNEDVEIKLNKIAAEIDMIESIHNALMSSLFGSDCLSKKDAYCFAYLLEYEIKNLKTEQNTLIDKLKI